MAPNIIKSVLLLLALSACDSTSTRVQSNTVLAETPQADPVLDVADLSDDILIPPEAPPLDITYRDQSLIFSWQTSANINMVSLFAFNTTTASEELISNQISATDNNYILPIDPEQTDLNEWLYSIELCTQTDCVSSYRTAVNTPPIIAQLELAEGASGVFWQPTLNRSGNVLVAISPDTQSAEVHFKTSDDWIYSSSIKPAGLNSTTDTTVDVAMSDSGDTIAIAIHQPQTSELSISLFDRLGEAWFETSQWNTPYEVGENPIPDNLIALAADASALLVVDQDGISRYSREDLIYRKSSTIKGSTPTLTWDASPDLTQLTSLSQQPNSSIELSRSIFRDQSYEQSIITTGLPISSASGATIQINSQGDEILLAAWQLEENKQPSPSVWHLAVNGNSVDTLSVQHEAASGEASKQLVFNSSDDLKTSYLSWNDNSLQQIQMYQLNEQNLLESFDLDATLTLTQQPYGLAVSGDGARISWANEMVYTFDQHRAGK